MRSNHLQALNMKFLFYFSLSRVSHRGFFCFCQPTEKKLLLQKVISHFLYIQTIRVWLFRSEGFKFAG